MNLNNYYFSKEYDNRDIHLIDEDMEYMDLFLDDCHQITDIVLYLGQTSIKGEVCAKVCNSNDARSRDIFTIYIKEKIIKGKVKISDDKLFEILKLLTNNEQLIEEYSDVQNSIDGIEFMNRLIL